MPAQVFALWYRAPELFFGSRCYGPCVDIWGAGCILAGVLEAPHPRLLPCAGCRRGMSWSKAAVAGKTSCLLPIICNIGLKAHIVPPFCMRHSRTSHVVYGWGHVCPHDMRAERKLGRDAAHAAVLELHACLPALWL